MRGGPVLLFLVALALPALPGCARQRTAVTAQAPAVQASPPADPDLSAVAERYYQLVEGKHWSVAERMLSPRLRASLDEAHVQQRYAAFANSDVTARQSGDRMVAARLVTPSATLRETLTFRWDGTGWQIDRIDNAR